MNATHALALDLFGLMVVPACAQAPRMKMTTDIPASITAPGAVKTSIGTLEFFDSVPKKATVETVYDYLDRSRAVEVFLNSIPAMSICTLREGQASVGAEPSHAAEGTRHDAFQ